MGAIRSAFTLRAFESAARAYGHSTVVRSRNVPQELTAGFECVLAALYLAGAPRGIHVSPRNWADVLRTLRSECVSFERSAKWLRQRGLREEALALETPGLLDWAERRVNAGVVLTAASPEYPLGWIRKLGGAAPPAVWKRGAIPEGPFLAVLGSRRVGFEERLFAKRVGEEAVRLGYAVVSGAAAGCDRAAARGALGGSGDRKCFPLIEILPCGIRMRGERFGGCVLSPFACSEEFSGPNAMRRNALIYSMVEAAVIVHARFGEGGTWRGAVEANRRKLSRLIVRDEPEDVASRALIGLGGAPLKSPFDLKLAVQAAESQGDLAL